MPRFLGTSSVGTRAAAGLVFALACAALALWVYGGGPQDAVPRSAVESAATPGPPAQVELVVEVKGGGSVTPGSGLYDTGSEVTLTAVADTDWAFDEWWGDLPGRIDRYAESISFTIEDPMVVRVDFIERPGLSGLDMVGDLAYFLRFIGSNTAVNTFDRNGVDYDSEMNHIYVGNGMPDVAELYLLETVLRTRHLSLTHRSGVSHEVVWDAWRKNLAQAETDLPGQDARVIRVVAAYMTVGDFDTVESTRDLVQSAIRGVAIDPHNYDLFPQRYLYWRRDADNDGVPNLAEWKLASPDGSLENLEAFGRAATDGKFGDIDIMEVAKIMMENE